MRELYAPLLLLVVLSTAAALHTWAPDVQRGRPVVLS